MTELQTTRQENGPYGIQEIMTNDIMQEIEGSFDQTRRRALLLNARVMYALQGAADPNTETIGKLIRTHVELIQALERLLNIYDGVGEASRSRAYSNEIES